MVDFKKSTGSTGEMMIRDTGTYVEFWLRASSYTYNTSLPWGYKVNGVTDTSNRFNFTSSGSWQRLGRWNVTTDQTVTFYLYDSGTSGLGGPTTLSASINRTSKPEAPYAPTLTSVGGSVADVKITDRDNGGLAITARQLSYGKTSSASTTIVSSDGTTRLSGLDYGSTYYIKARVQNSKGWSPWSTVRSFKTDRTPYPPPAATILTVTQSTVSLLTTVNGNDGGSPILERQIGYGTHPSTAQLFKNGTGSAFTLTGLTPGTRYYIWVRVRNAIGWSSFSPRREVVMQVGAKVMVFGNYVNAGVYVRHNGVWKLTQPYVKIAGLWQHTR